MTALARCKRAAGVITIGPVLEPHAFSVHEWEVIYDPGRRSLRELALG